MFAVVTSGQGRNVRAVKRSMTEIPHSQSFVRRSGSQAAQNDGQDFLTLVAAVTMPSMGVLLPCC